MFGIVSRSGSLFATILLLTDAAAAAERHPLSVVDLKPSPRVVQIPYWQLTFDPESSALLSRLTQENIDRQIILRLDGKEISAPWIHEPILGPSFNLTGAEFDPATVERIRSGNADLTVEVAPE